MRSLGEIEVQRGLDKNFAQVGAGMVQACHFCSYSRQGRFHTLHAKPLGLLANLDEIAFEVAHFEELGVLAIALNFGGFDPPREQVLSGLRDVGSVEHGSLVAGGNVARAKDEIDLVGKPEL